MSGLLRGAILAALVVLSAPASATTVVQRTLDEIIQSSERVVVATVVGGEAGWQGQRIVTVYQLDVEEVWKGPTSQTLEVASLGGIVGELGQHVPGMPRFNSGERVLLFLRRGFGDQWFPVGLWQGVYQLPAQASSDVLLPMPPGGAHLLGDPLDPPQATSLSELRARVRELSDE